MKNIRILNGYVVIYFPGHPKSMTTKVWNGYVYEHIIAAEKLLGRPLQEGEVVHHEDKIRSNNEIDNIKVFKTKGDHNRYHRGFKVKKLNDGSYVCEKARNKCIDCGVEVSKKIYVHCKKCALKKRKNISEKKIPSKKEIEEFIFKIPTVHIAKKYGVTGKAVEKWCKKYEILKPPRGYWSKQKKGF